MTGYVFRTGPYTSTLMNPGMLKRIKKDTLELTFPQSNAWREPTSRMVSSCDFVAGRAPVRSACRLWDGVQIGRSRGGHVCKSKHLSHTRSDGHISFVTSGCSSSSIRDRPFLWKTVDAGADFTVSMHINTPSGVADSSVGYATNPFSLRSPPYDQLCVLTLFGSPTVFLQDFVSCHWEQQRWERRHLDFTAALGCIHRVRRSERAAGWPPDCTQLCVCLGPPTDGQSRHRAWRLAPT